jgi:large subunit ribosomal protein L10
MNGGAVPTERKVAQVAELKELIASAEVAIAASFQGMPVAEQVGLRKQLVAAGVQLRVVKNTLLRLAASEAGREDFAALIDGPTALVIGTESPVDAARVLVQYQREHRNTTLEFRNAVVSGELVDADYVRDLATVPPREELLARIAGGLTGKLIEFMGLIEATTRDFAGLIEARAEQLETAAAE